MSESLDERRHCEQMLNDWCDGIGVDHQVNSDFIDLLVNDRATLREAADKAGFERGFDAGCGHGAEHTHWKDVARDAEANHRAVIVQRNALQSKYDCLVAAVATSEAAMREAPPTASRQQSCAVRGLCEECANVLRDTVDAAVNPTLRGV
jgi:hypothetical protein